MRNSAPSIEPLTLFARASEESSGVIELRALGTRDDVADEVLGIGVPSVLTTPFSSPPLAPSSQRGRALFAASVAFFLAGTLAFATAYVMTQRASAPAAARTEVSANASPTKSLAPKLSLVVDDAVVDPPESATDPTHPPPPQRSTPAPLTPRVASGTGPSQRSPLRTAPAAPTPRPAERWETGAPASAPVDASLDSLLDRALGGAPTNDGAGEASAARTLPETPTRAQVLTTLRALEGEVRECAEGERGLVESRLVVAGATGRVSTAHVSGDFAGTAQGSCIARVLRTAQFPQFSRERFEVSFPYRL